MLFFASPGNAWTDVSSNPLDGMKRRNHGFSASIRCSTIASVFWILEWTARVFNLVSEVQNPVFGLPTAGCTNGWQQQQDEESDEPDMLSRHLRHSVLVMWSSALTASDGVPGSRQDVRVVSHLPGSARVLGYVYVFISNENHIFSFRGWFARRPMRVRVPARLRGHGSDPASVQIRHVQSDVIDRGKRSPISVTSTSFRWSPAGSFNHVGKREPASSANCDSSQPRIGLHAAVRHIRSRPNRNVRHVLRFLCSSIISIAVSARQLRCRPRQ